MARRITTKYDNLSDSEKLLEEIIAKRRAKQQSKKTTASKVSFKLPKSIEQKTKEEQNVLENDQIYERILQKKQARLNKVKEKKTINVKSVEVEVVDKKINFNRVIYNKYLNTSIIVLSCLLVFIIFYIISNYSYALYDDSIDGVDFEYVESYFVRKDPEYISCMNSILDSSIIPDDMNVYIDDLNEYLSQYKVSVLYYDLTNNFKYTYGENGYYYAASTAKMVVALYIYKNASDGLINLDDTIVFQRKYRNPNSLINAKYNYGTRITIRELVEASILVSDNSAYNMLVDYVGKNNIIAYGHSLGASYTLNTDTFGHININDAYYYLNALNGYLNSPGELPMELKKLFLDADENNLNLEDLNVYAAQKYGHYGAYYHNIGIMYAEHPYLLAILSLEGTKDDLEERINSISQEVYQFHLNYYSSKENYCINTISK